MRLHPAQLVELFTCGVWSVETRRFLRLFCWPVRFVRHEEPLKQWERPFGRYAHMVRIHLKKAHEKARSDERAGS